VKCIGYYFGKYINRFEPKDHMLSYVKICVEVDVEKGILEAIHLTLYNWLHVHLVDYDQLLFKCNLFCEYLYFAKECKNNFQEAQLEQENNDQWQTTKRKKTNKKNLNQEVINSNVYIHRTSKAPERRPGKEKGGSSNPPIPNQSRRG
jgi:hypothetical protein